MTFTARWRLEGELPANVVELFPEGSRKCTPEPSFDSLESKQGPKLHMASLDALARRDASLPLNQARFIAELDSINPELALALGLPITLDVPACSPASPDSSSQAFLPPPPKASSTALDPPALPAKLKVTEPVRRFARDAQLVCELSETIRGWAAVFTFCETTTRDQAREARRRLLERVSTLGATRGALVFIGLRETAKNAGGPHLDVTLSCTEAEALALKAEHETLYGVSECELARLGQGGFRKKTPHENALKNPTGQEMFAHYARWSRYVTRQQGAEGVETRDPVLDFGAVGSLAGVWVKHRNAVAGKPSGCRCQDCFEPLQKAKTGRPRIRCAKCKRRAAKLKAKGTKLGCGVSTPNTPTAEAAE